MRLWIASLGLVGLLACGPAHAQAQGPAVEVGDVLLVPDATRVPNFLGTTGLLYVPSAYTIGDRAASAHFHANADFRGGGFLLGITNRLEVGLSFLDTDGPRRSIFRDAGVQFVANAKLLLLEETAALPAITFGVTDAFTELRGDASWYVVGSKFFTPMDTDQPFALRGHLGYGDGLFDEEVFAGAELIFDQNLSIMAEFLNGDFNVGGRARYRGVTVSLGLFDDLKQFGGGISYTAFLR